MRGLLIGLTGGIAAGKSSVAAMFGELGASLLDADKIAHQVMRDMWEPTTDGRLAALINMPEGEFSTDGIIDRKKLGRILFADPDRRHDVEDVLYPLISVRSMRMVDELWRRPGTQHVVYEAALLVEAGRHKWPDKLVVVRAEDRVRIARLMARNSLSEDEARLRLAAQLPQEKKVALADFVIDNSGSREETKAQVATVWERLNAEGQ